MATMPGSILKTERQELDRAYGCAIRPAGAFNPQLSTGLAGESKVLLVDVFVASRDQSSNPAAYGLTNVRNTVCDLSAAKNPLDSSLVCNGSNLKSADVSHYAYADDVHPTPYNNLLLARQVAKEMTANGWW